MVRILPGRGDVNLNAVDEYGKTLLFIVTRKGHEGVAKILLKRVDFNSDMTDLADEIVLG